ncbi:MAG TPA: hypothetical protein DCY13_01625, partial [Verrucomicrobiales bacterium]|nr:hypothetical protein [Verrucomicrobiales bacterium]
MADGVWWMGPIATVRHACRQIAQDPRGIGLASGWDLRSTRHVPRPAPLQLLQQTDHTVRLQSARGTVQLEVLSGDLFRLRIARGRRLTSAVSWSVTPPAGDPGSVRWERRGRTLAAITGAGKFSLRTDDGRWRLVDDGGELLLDG